MTATLVLTASYMVTELVGGVLSGSLALLADAGHMLSDVAALALALFAMWVARRPPSSQSTYGYHRTEILAALANGVALLVIAWYVCVEAYQRLLAPPVVKGGLMLVVATGGLVVNLVSLALLSGGRSESLNVRGAWLHVLSDALGSVGAIASGGLIWVFGWRWADPVASLLIGLLVIHSGWALLKETVAVLMENAPRDVDVADVRAAIRGHDAVEDVHDLHVWTITSGRVCLSAHVVTSADGEGQQRMLACLTELMRERFGIVHVTIQLEHSELGPAGCVGCV